MDYKPNLFTPPTKGTQTVVKDGHNGWQCNTFNGRTWSCISTNNWREVETILQNQLNKLAI